MEKRKLTIEQLTSQYGKIPPQACEIEEAVLGALMLESEAIDKVSEIIKAESFYKDEHQKIFRCIKDLRSKEKPIDIISVTQELKNKQELDEIGGTVHIAKLTQRVASAYHIEYHAMIIAQKYIQREMIRISNEIQVEAYDDQADIGELLDGAKKRFSDLEDSVCGNTLGKTQSEVIGKTVKDIEEDYKLKGKGLPGVTTGILNLNQATGGWRKQNLIVLGARPSVGKTSLALHFAKVAAQSGKYVNFYSLEMSSEDLMRISISGASDVNRSKVRDGNFEEWDWEKINQGVNKLYRLPIIWMDDADTSVERIKVKTRKLKKEGRCDLVIIDYLQLITPSDKKVNREQQISEMSRELKKLARREDVPIIILSALNREAEGVKPNKSHLRESGALEQDADVIILPWIDASDGSEVFNLIIDKNRRGKTGDFPIERNSEMTWFGDIDTRSNTERNMKDFKYNPNQQFEPTNGIF